VVSKRRRDRETRRFVRLEHTLLHSPAYRSLSPLARTLLIELVSLHNGSNNGEIYFSQRDAAAAAGVADVGSAGRGLKELLDRGFIAVTRPGAFTVKERHATVFRLTFELCQGRPPTNDWRGYKFEPEGKAWKRLARSAKTNLRCGKAALAVLETDTPFSDKRPHHRVPVEEKPCAISQPVEIATGTTVSENDTNIVCHTHSAELASREQREALRERVRHWLEAASRSQRLLARLACLNESKLSRFVNDWHGRRTLTLEQYARLIAAVADQA